jgi:penicillin-binding protein 2
MRKKGVVGHAFSDHVFEERVKRKKGFSGSQLEGLYNFIPLLILCVVFALLAMRLFTLQIVRASYYSRLSDANRIRTELISAPRGIIFDKNGEALVRNIPAFGTIKNNKIEWLDRDQALKMAANGTSVLAIIKRDYLYKDIFSHVIGYVGQVNSDEY